MSSACASSGCACAGFVPNAFKRDKCRECFHALSAHANYPQYDPPESLGLVPIEDGVADNDDSQAGEAPAAAANDSDKEEAAATAPPADALYDSPSDVPEGDDADDDNHHYTHYYADGRDGDEEKKISNDPNYYRSYKHQVSSAERPSGDEADEVRERLENGLHWLREFHSIRTRAATTPHERQEQQRDLDAFLEQFERAAVETALTVLEEWKLPACEKTVKPFAGGILGGLKFLGDNGVFVKKAQEVEGVLSTYTQAVKVAKNEARTVRELLALQIVGLGLPLMVIVQVRGRCFIASAVMPIRGAETLVYGSADGGRTVVNSSEEVDALVRQLAGALRLKTHLCGPELVPMHTGADVEGHEGGDGLLYLLDLGRVLPPAMRSFPGLFIHLLRLKFMREEAPTALSSDAFSNFGRHGRPEDDDEAAAAIKHLETVVVARCARALDAADPPVAHADVSAFVHEHGGVNVRLLGLVRAACARAETRRVLMQEMVARACKQEARERLAREARTPDAETALRVRRAVLEAPAADKARWTARKFPGVSEADCVGEDVEDRARLEALLRLAPGGVALQWPQLRDDAEVERLAAPVFPSLEVQEEALVREVAARRTGRLEAQRRLLELYELWSNDRPEETRAKAEALIHEMEQEVKRVEEDGKEEEGEGSRDDALREVALTMRAIGSYFRVVAAYARGLEAYERAAAAWAALGHDINTAVVKHEMAFVYKSQGEYARALALYEEVLAIKKAKLGADHPDTATTMFAMAAVYDDQGEYTRALALYEEVLAIEKAKLGADHPHTATTMHNMAMVYREQGEYARALALFEEVDAINKAKLGADHPHTAITMNQMAAVFLEQGEYARALALYEEVDAINKAKLGANHPSTANTMYAMAMIHGRQGEYARALALYEEVLAIEKVKLGADHPETATTMHAMAMVYSRQLEYVRALALYEDALAIYKAKLGADHPDTAKTMHEIAVVYYHQGEHARARALFEEVLAIREAKLGADHPSTQITRDWLADLAGK